MKKKIYLKKLRIFLILILLVVFIYSSFKVFSFYIDTKENKRDNKNLIEEVIKEIPMDNDSNEVRTLIDFNKLLEINKDTKGWIKYNNDEINYPVVQANDNEYYVRHTFYKKYNQAGSIFMDYRNDSFEDKNVILYGHNMLDRSMFGSLKDILEKDFFLKNENNIIEIIDSENNILKYQIFSYYIIEKEEYYITTSFDSDKEFLKFLNIIKGRSYKKFDVDLDSNDKILTLSTCVGTEGTTRRKVVHAKRILEL